MKPIKRPSNLSGIRANMFTQRQEHTLFEQTKDYASRYLDELNERPVYPSKEAIAALKVFDEPLPQGPQSASDILQLLQLDRDKPLLIFIHTVDTISI